jgi:hypothetical protein
MRTPLSTAQSGVGAADLDPVGVTDAVTDDEAVMEAVTDAAAPTDSDALGDAVLVLVCV